VLLIGWAYEMGGLWVDQAYKGSELMESVAEAILSKWNGQVYEQASVHLINSARV